MITETIWIQSGFAFFAGWSAALVCVLVHVILTIREEKRR